MIIKTMLDPTLSQSLLEANPPSIIATKIKRNITIFFRFGIVIALLLLIGLGYYDYSNTVTDSSSNSLTSYDNDSYEDYKVYIERFQLPQPPTLNLQLPQLNLVETPGPPSDTHLVIILHGLGAFASHKTATKIKTALTRASAESEFPITNWIVSSLAYADNWLISTKYPGIEIQALSACQMIQEILYKERDINKISIVGRSQGGITGRWVLQNCDINKKRRDAMSSSETVTKFSNGKTVTVNKSTATDAITKTVNKSTATDAKIVNFISSCSPMSGVIIPPLRRASASSPSGYANDRLQNALTLKAWASLREIGQKISGPYGYTYDPLSEIDGSGEGRKWCTVLDRLNNECYDSTTNSTKSGSNFKELTEFSQKQKNAILSLEKFMMVQCNQDTVLVPKESARWWKFEYSPKEGLYHSNKFNDRTGKSHGRTGKSDVTPTLHSSVPWNLRGQLPESLTTGFTEANTSVIKGEPQDHLILLDIEKQKMQWQEDRLGLREMKQSGRLLEYIADAPHDSLSDEQDYEVIKRVLFTG